MLEELIIWVKYNCFHMRPKKGVRNLMDSRNVNKWKYVTDENFNKKRIIRRRRALRGFKDRDAELLETRVDSCPTITTLNCERSSLSPRLGIYDY